MAVFAQTMNVYGYAYGIDSYYHEPRWVKLIFASCKDESPVYVPANARRMSIGSFKGGCCLKAIEMADKDQKWLDTLTENAHLSKFAHNQILPWHGKTHAGLFTCGNLNFVIDRHGRLGRWASNTCPNCVRISSRTAGVVGKDPNAK